MARTTVTKSLVKAQQTAQQLTKAQLKHFRQMLDDKAVEIRANLRSAAATKALARGGEFLDEEELPTQSHEEWIFLNRNNIDAMLLREIDQALVRMSDGSYGACPECDEAISIKRLEALPWARYCVSCQELLSAVEEDATAEENQIVYRD